MLDEVLFFGTNSGRDVEKLKKSSLRTKDASKIDCVLLEDAVANFECRLVSEHGTGDHVIFVGSIVAAHMNEDPEIGRLYKLEKGLTLGSVRRLS